MRMPLLRSHFKLRDVSSRVLALSSIAFFWVSQLGAQTADEIVRGVIRNELYADANDHSFWMYREKKSTPDKGVLQVTVETSQGSLSEVIEQNGRPLTAQEHLADLHKIDRMVNSASARRRAKMSERHDDEQARELANMLPNAFRWRVVMEQNNEIALSFEPNPLFRPQNMKAKVMTAISGTMIVDKRQMRLKRISGRLNHSVTFGWGLLGKLDQGGTCEVSRVEARPGVWKVARLQVHISGHTLFFETIGFQEDDVIDRFRPLPETLDLRQASEMLRSGKVARGLRIEIPTGW